MGNNRGGAVGKKKKGRPSLLDLQKRSQRIQIRNPNPKSTPNPYLKFPNSTPTRRSARRGTNPDADSDEEEEESEERTTRRGRKVKLVGSIAANGSDSDSSGSDSDSDVEGSRKKRKIESIETGKENSSSKAVDQTPVQDEREDPSDSGPTTPLPDIKLLEFILDRLQKKDTYGVFLDPVDPNELPDYHDIIKHPMDFTTVRTKLSGGAYTCLEEFERDVFLISSNGMSYNAADTIYYRQARSIQELAKKDFDNLRQESDKPHTARRGRPPVMNTIKKMLAKAAADQTNSGVPSNDTHLNPKNDLMRKGSSVDKMNILDSSTRTPYALRYNDTPRNYGDSRSEYSGSSLKIGANRNWKKQSGVDENRRDTYKQPIQPAFGQEPSVLAVFDSEKKQLSPVGLRNEHAYAKSLARFAANLGPIGWEIAARRIQKALPPGTKFGRGWVGANEAPHHQPSAFSTFPHILEPKILHSNTESSDKPTPTDSALPPSTSVPADSADGGNVTKNLAPQHCVNGFKREVVSETRKSLLHTRPPEELMPRAQVLDAVFSNGDNVTVKNPTAETAISAVGSMNPSVKADLNVDLPGRQRQQKQPDLALQL